MPEKETISHNSERRLAAIMFTDIVGSTSMMQKDEALAVKSVSKHKKVVSEAVEKHGGEVMNFYGDGSMSIFSSTTSVIECAIDIQQEMQNGLDVPLRIGIHIGEILIQDGEVFGDGVNVASRIESLGQKGTVLFSEEIYSKIRNNKNFKTAFVGDFDFKNVSETMAVYALANDGFPVPQKESMTGKLSETSDKNQPVSGLNRILNFFKFNKTGSGGITENSIAVLPFEKSGNLGEQTVIADGLADDIRSRLLVIKDLKVISRSSCMHFAGKHIPLNKVGKELGVSYVLEGRISKLGEKAQIQAELSHAPTNQLVWSLPGLQLTETNILNLQSQIAGKVAEELKLEITTQEQARLNVNTTKNPEAFLNFQRGQEMLHRGFGFKKELEAASLYFRKALELDPDFAQAWIGLADSYFEHIFWGRADSKTMVEKAMQPCLKAMELAPESGEAWGGLGSIYFYQGQKQKAIEYLKKAIELSPGYVEAYAKLGWISNGDRNFKQAIHYYEKAHSLDPLSTKFIGDIGQSYYFGNQFDTGLDYIENALITHPADSWLQWIKGLLLVGKGDFTAAINTLEQRPTGATNWLLGYAYGKAGLTEKARHVLEVNLQKRQDDYVPAHMIAYIYLGLGDIEKTLEWIETDAEEGAMSIIFWNSDFDPTFSVINQHPRYLAILNKIG